jgi:Lrp/AsnC family leucine-responsive transcriptional regulator
MGRIAMELDRIDFKLLNALQADARRPIAEIAAEIGLTTSPAYRRQRLLEEAGIIDKYVTLLDHDKLGLRVSVFVSVEVNALADEDFEAAVEKLPEVMECYLMTGETDYLIRVVAADIDHYQKFLTTHLMKIPAVRAVRTSLVLRRVIHKTALPVELAVRS